MKIAVEGEAPAQVGCKPAKATVLLDMEAAFALYKELDLIFGTPKVTKGVVVPDATPLPPLPELPPLKKQEKPDDPIKGKTILDYLEEERRKRQEGEFPPLWSWPRDPSNSWIYGPPHMTAAAQVDLSKISQPLTYNFSYPLKAPK